MSKWVRFNKDFNYRPTPGSKIAYKSGQHMPVPEGAAIEAIEGGFAEETGHVPQAGDAVDGSQPVRKSTERPPTPVQSDKTTPTKG